MTLTENLIILYLVVGLVLSLCAIFSPHNQGVNRLTVLVTCTLWPFVLVVIAINRMKGK